MKSILTSTWDEYLMYFAPDQKDTYFEEKYVKLYETESDKAICFVFEEDGNYLLYPFLSREFQYRGESFFDFETPYGYGGPIANTLDQTFILKALERFAEVCRDNKYVAGFTRFHPLLSNYTNFDRFGRLIRDRQTVAIDLSEDVDDIWMSEIHSKNRNVIKKGSKNNLRFEADYDYKNLEQFVGLYNATMDKLDADGFYYFADEYYTNFKEKISGSFIGSVYLEDRCIASAMFFYSECYGHYHLAGSDREYLKLSPNNFLLWNAALELKSKGAQLFHLGGGSTSDPDNSLLEFKSRFSKSRYDFHIGKQVFNQQIYDDLCLSWEQENPDKVEKYKHHLLKYKY